MGNVCVSEWCACTCICVHVCTFQVLCVAVAYLDELALSTADAGGHAVAAGGLVRDGVEHRVVEVEDGHIVLRAEQAAGGAEAVSLLGGLEGRVPLEGVLTDVDVLGGLHLLDDVLGVLDAGADGAAGARGRGVAARAAPVRLDAMGDDHSDSDGGGVDAGHHEAVLDDPRSRVSRHIG